MVLVILMMMIDKPVYYDAIFDISKAWHGYGIPISFLDPASGLRVEGLIYSPKKRKEDAAIQVSVYRNFDCQCLSNPVKVPHTNIFPSRRKLTKMNLGNCEETTVIDNKDFTLEEKEKLLTDIRHIYTSYKGVHWTANELAVMLNRPKDYDIISKMPFLVEHTKRNCRITNELSPTYKFDPPEKILEDATKKYSIASLEEEYKNCQKCALFLDRDKYGYSPTFGRGNKVNPKIFIIGESPGVNERDTGIPFHPDAPAGQDLFKVMKVAGIDQDKDCYITNSILCWPPPDPDAKIQNGKPKDEHISACNARLKKELAILKPKVILLLGSYAYKAFFGRFLKGVMANNIGWVPVSGDYNVYLTFHPSYIARQLSYEKDQEKKAIIKNSYLDNFIEVKRVADGSS